MAERAVRSAARRRERWLRSMWRPEQLSVRMAVATSFGGNLTNVATLEYFSLTVFFFRLC